MMHIAICSADMELRHRLSYLTEKALIRHGVLPKISIFPLAQELVSSIVYGDEQYTIALVNAKDDDLHTGTLCRTLPVILVGDTDSGPSAFDLGARYFIEIPATEEALHKAFGQCMKTLRKGETK